MRDRQAREAEGELQTKIVIYESYKFHIECNQQTFEGGITVIV